MVLLGEHGRQYVWLKTQLLPLDQACVALGELCDLPEHDVLIYSMEMTMPPISNEIEHTKDSAWHIERLRG